MTPAEQKIARLVFGSGLDDPRSIIVYSDNGPETRALRDLLDAGLVVTWADVFGGEAVLRVIGSYEFYDRHESNELSPYFRKTSMTLDELDTWLSDHQS